MYDYFCQYFGGWSASACRKGFCAEHTKIVLKQGKRIGCVSIEIRENEIYITNIQVNSKNRGKGIGKLLLENIIKEYAGHTIALGVFEANPARKLYSALGFEIVSNEKGVIRMERPLGK